MSEEKVECNRTDSCSHDSCEHHGAHEELSSECLVGDMCEEIGSHTLCVDST